MVKRLLNRGKSSGRSDDTNEDVIRARQFEYENKTAPVASYYAGFGKVVYVKGEGTIDDIFHSLSRQIESRQLA
ncbi:hypothetical protein [Paraflavitalea speifideaquila]|uniref:hypothetical protein n=1 Tax=Paraflavitalea speifideaquila TaxID=3076558 RepID=UPI0028E3DC43|nr:hypothetical protein [Paraflavitalea speifideiaquila]